MLARSDLVLSPSQSETSVRGRCVSPSSSHPFMVWLGGLSLISSLTCLNPLSVQRRILFCNIANSLFLPQHDPVLGVVPLKLSDALQTSSQVTRWYPLDGGIGIGRIRISLLFRSVEHDCHQSSWAGMWAVSNLPRTESLPQVSTPTASLKCELVAALTRLAGRGARRQKKEMVFTGIWLTKKAITG